MKYNYLLKMVEQIINGSPPEDWKTRDNWGDYQGYGALVDEVDPSNSGDVHGHGMAVGMWSVACKLAQAMRKDREEKS